MLKDTLFYGKILLFGEYGIIQDAMGLSIPFNDYKGSLKFDQSKTESNQSIALFYDYLSENSLDFEQHLDLKRLKKDIERGLIFDSSIPQGFGVGSSGALVASIYDEYAIDKSEKNIEISKENILKLKSIFSKMESYFHGKSSGLDPLICYLNLPILIKSKTDVDTVGLPSQTQNGKAAIFLIDTGIKGNTAPMVNIFMEKMKHEGFRKVISEQFKKYNDACIKSFLTKDINPLFNNLKHLSKVVFDNFKPMIPKSFHQLWKQGIDSNDFYLKLCGSGGGGFVLGFAQDYQKAQKYLKTYNPEVIFTF